VPFDSADALTNDLEKTAASERVDLPRPSWPASDFLHAVMQVCRHKSPAGWLQRQRTGLVFFVLKGSNIYRYIQFLIKYDLIRVIF
jgi:hypothetical protein